MYANHNPGSPEEEECKITKNLVPPEVEGCKLTTILVLQKRKNVR